MLETKDTRRSVNEQDGGSICPTCLRLHSEIEEEE